MKRLKRLTLIPVMALVAALASAPDYAHALDAAPPEVATPATASAAPESASAPAAPSADASKVATPQTRAGQPVIVDDTTQAIGVAGELLGAIRAGDWRYVAALLLILTMYAMRRLRKRIKIFDGPRGGAILIGLLGTTTAVTMTLLASGPFDWRLLLGGLGLTWTSVGGYQWARDLIWPKRKVADERILAALHRIASGQSRDPARDAAAVLPDGPRPSWATDLK